MVGEELCIFYQEKCRGKVKSVNGTILPLAGTYLVRDQLGSQIEIRFAPKKATPRNTSLWSYLERRLFEIILKIIQRNR